MLGTWDTIVDAAKATSRNRETISRSILGKTAANADGSQWRYLENHDKPRARAVFGESEKAASVLIFTLDGVPMIYSGQEIGEDHTPSLFEKEAIDWDQGYKKHSSLRKFYKKLAAFRAGHAALSRGQRFAVPTSESRSVLAYARSYRDDAVLVAINLSPGEFRGTMEVPEIFRSKNGQFRLKPLFSETALDPVGEGSAGLTLPPWGYQVWELK